MSLIEFVKMSGAGNDFVVVPGDTFADRETEGSWVRAVCVRRHGVGSDGVLFVRRLPGGDTVEVRFRNPDGSEAFCGNGARCGARYALDEGLAGPEMTLATAAGEVAASVSGDTVRLRLPAPVDHGTREPVVDGVSLRGRFVDAGCPHFVLTVDDPGGAPLQRWGPVLRRHVLFGSAGANVDLLAAAGEPRALRTWERGVEGETLACGSGAIAAAYTAFLAGEGRAHRLLPAGGVPLDVELEGEGSGVTAVVLSGDARTTFHGRVARQA